MGPILRTASLAALASLAVAACARQHGVPREVTARIEAPPGAPIRAFYRDGRRDTDGDNEPDGEWIRVGDDGAGTYRFDIESAEYAFGFTCVTERTQEQRIVLALVTDSEQTLTTECDDDPAPALVTVSGTVSGLTGDGWLGLLGGELAGDEAAAATDKYAAYVESGTRTLIYGRRAASGFAVGLDRVAIERDRELTAATVIDVDLATAGADTAEVMVTVTGEAPGATAVSSSFRPAGSRAALDLYGDYPVDAAAPAGVRVVPPALWVPGDQVSIHAVRGGLPGRVERIVDYEVGDTLPDTRELELPPSSWTAYIYSFGQQIRATTAPLTEAVRYTAWIRDFSTITRDGCGPTRVCHPSWTVEATPAFAADLADLATAEPDALDALGAWDERLEFPDGAFVECSIDALFEVPGLRGSSGARGTPQWPNVFL
jgi:hypothetical protein